MREFEIQEKLFQKRVKAMFWLYISMGCTFLLNVLSYGAIIPMLEILYLTDDSLTEH